MSDVLRPASTGVLSRWPRPGNGGERATQRDLLDKGVLAYNSRRIPTCSDFRIVDRL